MRIGRITKQITDNGRIDELSDKSGYRKLMISIYYPSSDAENDDIITYTELFNPCADQAVSLLKDMGVNETAMREIRTNIAHDLKLNKGIYPVIILSPAFGVERDMYLSTVQSLVENGYVVVTLGATYESIFTIFPDGEFIKQLSSLA